MKVIKQDLDTILASLRPLTVDWQDDISRRVVSEIEAMPVKKTYTAPDVQALLDKHFDDALLIIRLFLGQSKDQFTGSLRAALAEGTAGVKSYQRDKPRFLEALIQLGVLEAMAEQTNRTAKWSDVLVERLRSGRGSAISGQARGRAAEDFAEGIVQKVFDRQYASRTTFDGVGGKKAKCDFAIPSKDDPQILIESKGYAATGSKMTDVIGDIEKIITAKRSDTAFLFFTDGLTWRDRKNDMRQIVKYQNQGDITRIYTYAMAQQFEDDLRQLKAERGI